jgi:Sec-independent protein translocase protein TatA
MVPVSANLFPIAATAFLVVLAVVFVVFTAKYIRTRARGRGPVEMFSQPRHTFAQYDDDDDEGEGIETEEGGAKTDREGRQKSG